MQGVEMRMPTIEPNGAPGIDNERYVTRDGLKLGLKHWDAADPVAIIVALHGMSDYSNAFAMPAPYWTQKGISTYAYDQRGFGRSPEPGVWAGSEVMRRDLRDFVDVVRAQHPGIPVFVLGESMGGAVAMTAFAAPPVPHADGLILIAPAIWSWRTMPITYRVALWSVAHTFRAMTLSGSGLKIVPSDNIEMLRANGRDPLFQKNARVDAVYGLAYLMDEAYSSAFRIKAPMLFMYGGNDQIIPHAPTKTVVDELGSNATVKLYSNGYHMLLRDLDHEPRWADVANWVAARARRGMAMMAAAE